MLTVSEENYLKFIYILSVKGLGKVSTNVLAGQMNTTPASVTEMIRKLSGKDLAIYEKYKGVLLTETGKSRAIEILRKAGLWKVFLAEKLKFSWNELSESSDQLEHIHSPLLYSRLDKFLGYPRFDPLGDPIPDEEGKVVTRTRKILENMQPGETGILIAVNETDPRFLQYLDKTGIVIGSKIKVLERIDFDGSMEIQLNDKKTWEYPVK